MSLSLALSTLRFRAAGFVAAFIALLCGVAVVLACAGLLETGVRADVPAPRLAAAPIVVAGDGGLGVAEEGPYPERVRLDADLVGTVAALPGVSAALPDVTFPAATADGRPVDGHGWSSTVLAGCDLTAGSAPPGAGAVALDARLAGATGPADVVLQGSRRAVQVSGLLDCPAGVPAAVYVADEVAPELVGHPGTVDAIGVVPAAGTGVEELRARVDRALADAPARTLTGGHRGLSGVPDAAEGRVALSALAGSIGGMAVLIAVFVVASTLALSLRQRARELSLLRAIGATPGQVRRSVLVETLLLTALAAVPGGFLGSWLGREALDRLVGADVVPVPFVFHSGGIALLSAVGATLLIAVAASRIAVRRAARARPAEALADASAGERWLSWPRVLAGLLCLAGGTAMAIVTATVLRGPLAMATSSPAAVLWVAGLALLGPGVTRLVTALLRWPVRLVTGRAGWLADLNTRSRPVRVAGAVVPVMLVSGLALSLVYLQTSASSAAGDAYRSALRADAVLTAPGGLPHDLVDDVRSLPGVTGASAHVSSSGYVVRGSGYGSLHLVALEGLDGAGAEQTTRYRATAGSLADLRGETVALSEHDARSFGAEVGSTLRLRLGDSTPVALRVVAVYPARAGYETVLLPADLLAAHTDSGLVQQVLVTGDDGSGLRTELAGLATEHPGLAVSDRSAVLAGYADGQRVNEYAGYLLVALVVGYAVISLVNSLVLGTAERRREFALQRLLGSTRGQVATMVTVESSVQALAGLVLGLVVAALTLVPFNLAVSDSPVPHGPVAVLVWVVVGAVLLTLGSSLVPTALALRDRPAEVVARGA